MSEKSDENTPRALTIPNSEVVLCVKKQHDALCKAIDGASSRSLRTFLGITAKELHDLTSSHTPFAIAFKKARAAGLETLADDLIDIPDDYIDPNRARLKSDNIKWLLSKRMSGKYGDKLTVNLEVVDLKGALSDARSRVVEAECVVIDEPVKIEEAEIVNETDIDIFS